MNAQIARFKQYLMYEKGLSPKSVEAYLHDVLLLEEFLGEKKMEDASFEDLQQFLKYLYQSDYNARSQARIISGMRAFYRYLIYANVLETDPTELLDAPKIGMHLPDVLTVEEIQRRVNSLAENNPMLGHRGCRLGITFPEITAMQTRAILGAACQLKKEGFDPHPEIMVPLIGILYEFKQQKEIIVKTAKEVFEQEGIEVKFEIGTMIEIPRAALTADRIATEAEYFSFGTNDLTQMTFGYSRDDIASFLPAYLEKKILKVDPFQVLDQNGVGQLIKMAVENGRKVRPGMRTGICGEHGGEPSSVKFCAKVGMNYASCSPFRVPIARLAAAHAAVEE